MSLITFAQYLESLSQLSPDAKNISDSGTNADYGFDKSGARSKYKTAENMPKKYRTNKPEKLFFGNDEVKV